MKMEQATTDADHLATVAGDSADQSDGFDRRILIVIVSAIGVVSNTFALAVLSRYKKLHSRLGSVLVFNQCLLDLCGSIFSLSYWISYILKDDMFNPPWEGAAGQLHCRIWVTGVLHWSLMTSSTFNLLMITLERYIMVLHPLYYKTNMTRQKMYVMIGCAWAAGFVYRLPWAMSSSALEGQRCVVYSIWPHPNWSRAFGVISFFYQFFVPAAAMCFMYLRIIRALRSRAAKPNQVAPAATVHGNMTKAQNNLTKTFVIVLLAFICCWITNQVFWLLVNLELSVYTHPDFRFTSKWLVFANCTVNPFIYIFSYEEFQHGMRLLLGCASSTNPTPAQSNGTESSRLQKVQAA